MSIQDEINKLVSLGHRVPVGVLDMLADRQPPAEITNADAEIARISLEVVAVVGTDGSASRDAVAALDQAREELRTAIEAFQLYTSRVGAAVEACMGAVEVLEGAAAYYTRG